MIDIHCHILHGLDDGPQHLETSLTMASLAAQDGIGVIIATPHTDGIAVNSDRVGAKVRELNKALTEHSIPLKIVAGYEIPCHLAIELASTHTLAGSKYVLIEFPHSYIPNDALGVIYNIVNRGLLPIIAHPERNREILAQPERLSDIVEAGALVQLTGVSLTGELGPDLQRCSMQLLRNEMVHFIATDSHSPTFRTPVLRKAHSMAMKIIGREKADLLTIGNPGRILKTMADQPTM